MKRRVILSPQAKNLASQEPLQHARDASAFPSMTRFFRLNRTLRPDANHRVTRPRSISGRSRFPVPTVTESMSLERRPALGTEDVAGPTRARQTAQRSSSVTPADEVTGQGPADSVLGHRFVTGRGAPGGPYRLIVLSARRIQGALPRTLDLSSPGCGHC